MVTKEELVSFSKEIADIYESGVIKAPIHLSDGSEDALIRIFKNIKPDDWVFSTYRSHYHALLKGIPRDWLKDQILKGNSMHIHSRQYKFFTSSIVGGICPIAVGIAMAIQEKNPAKSFRNMEHVWCFVGDMASEMGIFHECLKYSERHGLPITFVVEDNGVGVNTPTEESWGLSLFDEDDFLKRYYYIRQKPHSGVGKWIKF